MPLGMSSRRPTARGPLAVLRAVCVAANCTAAKAKAAQMTARHALRYNDERNGDDAMLTVKDKAPDISLEDQDGKVVSLKDFRGKTVVLFFYPKANTPG